MAVVTFPLTRTVRLPTKRRRALYISPAADGWTVFAFGDNENASHLQLAQFEEWDEAQRFAVSMAARVRGQIVADPFEREAGR